MGFSNILKDLITGLLVAAVLVIASSASANAASATVVIEKSSNLGTIRGIVRDYSGSPISDATVAIFRLGTSKLLKQVRSAADGSFLAKIIPGTYTVLAVAQGFNPVTLSDVQVNRATDVVYGFRLEPSGNGNTLPEKRLDRNSSKWRIRAAQNQRSIYQNTEGTSPVSEAKTGATPVESADSVDDKASTARRKIKDLFTKTLKAQAPLPTPTPEQRRTKLRIPPTTKQVPRGAVRPSSKPILPKPRAAIPAV